MIIVCVLSGIALVANIAVCVYTLHLSKQAEHHQNLEGYVEAIIEHDISAEKYKKEGTE